MEFPDPYASLRDRKLVVLGIPFDVETDELKYYMRKFGEIEDCVIMKDRVTRQSRGFGYVTFNTTEDARKATAAQHSLNGRALEVKVATPKDEMMPSASRKGGRIFVARIPPQVTDGMFRSYFQKYGVVVDAYMPKDAGSRTHRGIGFVTFENAESVDKIMNETHELGGSSVAVDRATPKEETAKFWGAQSFPDQLSKPFPDQWDKAIPEQWAKAIPEQWAKSFPDQFSFFMAAAAAAAQMGAFGGMGGAMEGFDFSGYGFPGFMGMGSEKADNAWDASEGEIIKNAKGQGNDSPGGGGVVPTLSPPAAGYAPQSSAPQNTAPVMNSAAAGYDPEAAQNNALSAYGPGVLHNSMYLVPNSDSGYGTNAPATSMPSAMYGSSASHSSGPNANISATGYGPGVAYSDVPTAAPGYGAGGYYNGAVANPASAAVAASAHSYVAEYGSGAPTSGGSYPGAGYGSGASYNGATAAPPFGSGYSSNASYAGAPAALPSGSGYSSRASYVDAVPTSGMGYGSSASYNDIPAGYGSSGPPVPTMGNKVFIGKLPHEATAEHLRTYFSSFGRILDVYVPKDAKKTGHRGFGFVTFFDDGVAERVALESHEILGQPIAVDRPTPQDSGGNFSSFWGAGAAGTWGGNTAALQRMGYGTLAASLEYFAGGLGSYAGGQPGSYDGSGANRASRPDFRYRPY